MNRALSYCLFYVTICTPAFSTELNDLDLESLLATDLQITSVMKRTNKASTTPASVYVISNEQMLNAGVTSIPQALTLAPGMQVRKIDNNKWAIGIRNSAGRYTSRLLVMIDGQSIYNPSFAGVYWEALNIPIFDIERIEITKGQGGLLWGSNATNGVVNIITKLSHDTRSTQITVKAGSTLKYNVSARVGGDLALGEHSSYRLYVNTQENNRSDRSNEWEPRDDGIKHSIGGRFDIAFNNDTSLLIQADYTDIKMGQTLELPSPITFIATEAISDQERQHTSLMLRLENRISDTANQTLQASYTKQNGQQPYYIEHFQNYDIDYQINTLLGFTQVDLGVNYRYNKIPFVDNIYVVSVNNIEYIKQYGGFAQANFSLIENELDLIVGNKSEYNSLTGWEHQPSLRFTWQPNKEHFIWSSFSQGVRIPSLVEFDYETLISGTRIASIFETQNEFIDNTYIRTVLRSNDELKSEKIKSTELGYRLEQDKWNLDLSFFYSITENALAIKPEIDPLILPTVAAILQVGDIAAFSQYIQSQTIDVNLKPDNKQKIYGTDFNIKWKINPSTNMIAGFSYARQKPAQIDNDLLRSNGYTKQFFLSLNKKINNKHNLMLLSRWESGNLYNTDNYTVLDASWSWQYSPQITFSLTGNNLLEDEHLEYARTNDTFDVTTYIERSLSLGMDIEF